MRPSPGAATRERSPPSVDIREDLGSEILVHFGVEAPPVRGEDVEAALGEEALEATSDQVRRKGSLFTARVSRESHAREGDALELAVNASRLHFSTPSPAPRLGDPLGAAV